MFPKVGLHDSFWPVLPVTATVERGEQYTLLVSKVTKKTRASDSVVPCVSEEVEGEYSYTKCVSEWARKAYRGLFKSNGTGAQQIQMNELSVDS